MDILHTLTTLDWEECPGCELYENVPFIPQAVVIRDAFYIAAVDKIYATTTEFTSWTVHDPPAKLQQYGFTSYHSQLLVVGGRKRGKLTNKVWISDNATDWQTSLPPMPNKRCSPLATNTGPSPECVIVAGGENNTYTYLTLVDVLLGKQWFTVESTHIHPYYASVHDGFIYYNNTDYKDSFIVQCQLQSLLAACKPQDDQSNHRQSLQSTL